MIAKNERNREMYRLFRKGVSRSELAKIYGLTPQGVNYILQRERRDAEMHETVKGLLSVGFSKKEVAEMCGISLYRITVLINRDKTQED